MCPLVRPSDNAEDVAARHMSRSVALRREFVLLDTTLRLSRLERDWTRAAIATMAARPPKMSSQGDEGSPGDVVSAPWSFAPLRVFARDQAFVLQKSFGAHQRAKLRANCQLSAISNQLGGLPVSIAPVCGPGADLPRGSGTKLARKADS
jgi:hypothetical protein